MSYTKDGRGEVCEKRLAMWRPGIQEGERKTAAKMVERYRSGFERQIHYKMGHYSHEQKRVVWNNKALRLKYLSVSYLININVVLFSSTNLCDDKGDSTPPVKATNVNALFSFPVKWTVVICSNQLLFYFLSTDIHGISLCYLPVLFHSHLVCAPINLFSHSCIYRFSFVLDVICTKVQRDKTTSIVRADVN